MQASHDEPPPGPRAGSAPLQDAHRVARLNFALVLDRDVVAQRQARSRQVRSLRLGALVAPWRRALALLAGVDRVVTWHPVPTLDAGRH